LGILALIVVRIESLGPQDVGTTRDDIDDVAYNIETNNVLLKNMLIHIE